MWTNQDQMFADSESNLRKIDKEAINVLDALACDIADGEVKVDSLNVDAIDPRFDPVNQNWSDGGKLLAVKYQV